MFSHYKNLSCYKNALQAITFVDSEHIHDCFCENLIGRRTLEVSLHPPVSQRPVLTGAPVQAGVGGVGGAGQVDRLAGPAATPRCWRGWQRHQRGVTGAEGHRGVAEWHVVAAASGLTAVCVGTVINAHLRDGHAQQGLQLQGVK